MKLWLSSFIVFVLLGIVPNVFAEGSCAYILSGYGSSTNKNLYQKIGAEYKKAGITPTYIEIDWSSADILDYIAQAKSKLVKCDGEDKYFYGFSLGGLIALALAKDEAAKSIIVSSVAPFFKEDIKKSPWHSLHGLYNWWLFGGNESISEQIIISSINSLHTKVILLVGSKEKELVVDKSKELAKDLLNGKLVLMDDIGHGISQHGHINYIISSINSPIP